MYRGVSETARYGGLTVGGNVINQETKERMRNALRDIQSGAFAERWVNSYQNEKARAFEKYLDELDAHPIEQVGRRLRQMMWPEETSGSGKAVSWSKLQTAAFSGRPSKKELRKQNRQNPRVVRERVRDEDKLQLANRNVWKMKSTSPSKSTKKLKVLDATLRERTFGVSFSIGEKLSIASQLDELGVSFIESSFSGENPNDLEYLKKVRSILKGRAEQVVFLPESIFSDVSSHQGLSEDWVRHVSLRANCWQSHLSEGFSHKKIEPEANLRQTEKTLSSLKKLRKEILLYAQHFFDGFFEDTSYALSILETAVDAGVTKLVLSDSRGGSFPEQVSKAVKLVNSHFSSKENITLGIHCHNDTWFSSSEYHRRGSIWSDARSGHRKWNGGPIRECRPLPASSGLDA